jgi:hypothetical protein
VHINGSMNRFILVNFYGYTANGGAGKENEALCGTATASGPAGTSVSVLTTSVSREVHGEPQQAERGRAGCCGYAEIVVEGVDVGRSVGQ